MGKQQPLGQKKNAGKKFTYEPPARQIDAQRLQGASRSQNLANQFQDRRFGANDPRLDDETKNLRRFTRERQFLARRKEKFQLEDEETFALTHRGERLDAMPDDFVQETERPDESELSDFDSDVVNELHFSSPSTRTPQSRYEEIIARSKYNKYLQHKEKEDMQILAEKVDKELPHLANSLQFRDFRAKRAMDEYDLLVQELKDEVKVSAGTDSGYLEAVKAKKELEIAGLDYSLPREYEDFLAKLTNSETEIGKNLRNFLIWNSPKLPSEQGQLQILLSYMLRAISQEALVPSLITSGVYSEVMATVHSLCGSFPETSAECVGKLLEAGCSGIANTAAFVDLLGNLLPVGSFSDEIVGKVRETCGNLLLNGSIKGELRCGWMVFLGKIYAKKWIFPVSVFVPEFFALIKRVLVRTRKETALETGKMALRDLIVSPTYSKSRSICISLLIDAMQVFKTPGFKSFFQRFISLAQSDRAEFMYNSVFDPQSACVQIQTAKVFEIPSYEPLVTERITTLHKNKDGNKTKTETEKLKSEVKSAKKEARKALQRQSFAEELRKQEENRLRREEKATKGRKAKATLEDLQAEYKRMVTSQGERRTEKLKRRRMAGNEVERT